MLYTTAPALAIFARYNLLETLDGARVLRVEQMAVDAIQSREIYHLATDASDSSADAIDWVVSWQKTGLITIADKNGNGVIELYNVGGSFAEASIDPDTIVLSTPEVAGLAPWVIALVATGGLAAALSTAAGLLLVISSSIAHDLYIHFFDPHASEAKRVAVGRVMIVLAIGVAGYFGINPPGFVAQMVAFAFGLAAASFFPVILLGIFDKRTNRAGAVCGMIVGILFTAIYIVGNRSDKILGTEGPLMEPWCFGISAEGIGTIGCMLNFIVTWTVSRFTSPPPRSVQELVESVRIPAGAHKAEVRFDESDAGADNP